MKGNQLKWLIGGVIILVSLSILYALNIEEGTAYFLTPVEAYNKGSSIEDRTVRVAGMVQPASKNWNGETLQLVFVLTDFEGHDYKVSYKGTPPDLFKENQGVVVEGLVDNSAKTIVSKKLMVKHSEEYRVPGEHSIDKELLKESFFGKDKK